MKTRHLFALLLAALGFANLRAATDTAALETKLERVLYIADAALLAEAETELASALAAEPKSPALLYLRGFATYVKSAAGYVAKDMKAVRAALESADKELAAVQGEPWAAEALALRGMIAGQLISVRGGASAMTLGPKMNERTSAAFDVMPDSPRVLVCHAVMYLNTPAMFGGDKAQAMQLFARAASSATWEKSAATSAAGPRWGRAWALAWLAQASLQAGDLPGARRAAEEALALAPEYRWVKKGLLPAIEKKEATPK